jgi:ankyrin repeat protein
VVLLLLEKGADIDTRNGRCETALHEAAGGEHEAVLRLFLEKGANRNAKEQNGSTALH